MFLIFPLRKTKEIEFTIENTFKNIDFQIIYFIIITHFFNLLKMILT